MSQPTQNRWLGLELDEKGELVLSPRSLYKSLGGALGLLESAIPPISFSITFGISKSVVTAVAVAVTLTLVILVIQIIRKRPIMNAIASVLGIAIAAWLALRGGAGDFFIKDFWVNAAWATGLLGSVLFRVPAIGYLLLTVGEVPEDWRKRSKIYRRMRLVTVIWAALYVLRLVVQLPLYFANNVLMLGIMKTVLGLPMFALWILFTWLLLRKPGWRS